MSKHRLHEDDETTLLPRAVGDPAAEEPAPRPAEHQAQAAESVPRPAERPAQVEEPAPRRLGRQPLVIGVATMCLLVSGAAAWALATPAPQPSVALPTGRPSTSGAGFTDGFGVMTPSAVVSREAKPARPSASPSASAPASSPTVSPAPASSGPRPSNQPAAAPPDAASATYDVNAWGNGYVISVRVRNTGTTPLAWKVRIQLPQGSTVDGDWEADRSGQDGVWVFTPERGALSPGATVTFGFIGRRGPGDFAVTCTVDDVACKAG
ncbi:cellulose binding domain-containing protein [Catellatospora paridis]|uniref:cellulose binding domain-containing protein n=1 Tax=Catellatospora paridis TaxID=1617086 RepID=UPI0012D4750D|nr:cellulose binding domain-containing protein [Catellatospora paridis]